jgi:hypothetical protein
MRVRALRGWVQFFLAMPFFVFSTRLILFLKFIPNYLRSLLKGKAAIELTHAYTLYFVVEINTLG